MAGEGDEGDLTPAMDDRFRAILHMLPTAEGGRKTPFKTNYRPQFYLNDPDVSTSFFVHQIEGVDEVAPGDSAMVEASLLNPILLGESVSKGTRFWLREGGRPVGWGIIC